MANARMYLRCNMCKKAIMISRHYGEPWQVDRDRREIDSFFRRHYECLLPGMHCSHEGDFSLVYDGGDEEYEVEYTAFEKVPDYVQEDIKAHDDPDYEEDDKWLIFFVQGSLGDVDDVTTALEEKNIDWRLLPEATTPLLGSSMIAIKCVAPDQETFDWVLNYLRRHPKTGGVTSKRMIYSKIEEGEE